MTKGKTKRTEHLISLQTQAGVTVHAYMITKSGNRRQTSELEQQAADRLLAFVAQQGWPYLPIMLHTQLTTGGDIVRRVLTRSDEAGKAAAGWQRCLDGPDEFHFTMIATLTDSSDDATLMALH